MIWYMVPVLLTIHLLAYTTISAQETTTISMPKPITLSTQEPTTISAPETTTISAQETTTISMQKPITLSTQEPTTISAPETTTISMQKPTVSTQELTTISAQETTTISMQKPITLSTQEPTTVSTQEPTTISAPETTTISMQKPITIFTQEPTTLSTQKPTTISTQEPTTISIQKPPTISKQKPTTISTQEPTTVSTQEPTTISTQETTTNSIPEISTVSSTPSTKSEDTTNLTYESNSQKFECKNGGSLDYQHVCDGEGDCQDGSDEENCCREGFFKCNNGQCIDEELVCNDDSDCPDGSDELNCIPKCDAGQFQCKNGECIPNTKQCDRFPHCKDYSDEKDCSYGTKNDSCSEYEFSCRSSRSLCIPMLFFCDGKNDCMDNSDEINCSNSEIHDISEIIKEFKIINESDSNAKWFRDAHAVWITELFEEVQTLFVMDSLVNENCFLHYTSYLLHLQNQTAWAVKMMESSEWPSVGLFAGRMNNFGSYDKCLSISSHGIEGRYCLVEVIWTSYPKNYIPDTNSVQHTLEEQSVWKRIATLSNNSISGNEQEIKFALCIPSSCQADDLALSLEDALSQVFESHKLGVSVRVSPASCKAKNDQYSFSLGFYLMSLLILIILSLVILSTYLDVTSDLSGNLDNSECCNPSLVAIYKCFSIVENFQKLKNYGENDYSFVYFVKVVILILVIYCNRFLHSIVSAEFNAETFKETWKWSKAEVMYEDMISVSFMICGFLMFNLYFTRTKRGGCVFTLINIFSRSMKIISIISILVLYITYILPYTSDGPLWNDAVAKKVGKCMDHWWAIPLAISNWMIESDGLCVLVSWYSAVNIQLTILGGILLLIYCNHEKIGLHMVILAFISSITITFIKFYHQYPGILRMYTNSLEYSTIQQELTNFYTATYTRVGPYLVGFITALVTKLVNDNKNLKHKLSKKPIFVLWTFGIVFIEMLLQNSPLSIIFGEDYSRLENAVYASVHQSLFVSVWAVLFFMYFTSDTGILQELFNCKMFAPLGRLTYSVYLSNIIVYFYYTCSQRQFTSTYSRINLVILFFGDMVYSYVIGLFVHLVIEAPIANISRFVRESVIDKRPGDSRPFDHNDHGSTNIMNTSKQSLSTCNYSVEETSSFDTISVLCDS